VTIETEALTRLREAARQRDWDGCHDASDALLSRLSVPTMLRIARDEVQRRLPLFERHHPNMHWPRVWLDALATDSLGMLDESTPEVLEEAPGPGGNSFTEAVRQLALAAAAEGEQRVIHAREAISQAILAEGSEAGGSAHRELWDLWYREGYSGGDRLHPDAMVTIANDPSVVAAELAAWNRLADELAAALGVKG